MKKTIDFTSLVALAILIFSINPADAFTRFEVKQMIIHEATNSDVPIALALGVAKVESDFNARALSSAGARGVMQIMPATATHEFNISPNRLWNAKLNIRLGIQFLEQLHDQYKGRWDLALSHYNGGTVRGNKPHKYTQKYIKNVQKWQRIYQEQAHLFSPDQPKNDTIEFALADLQDWQARPNSNRYEEDWFEELIEEQDSYDTQIIIVKPRKRSGWRRPHRPRPLRHAPPPRRYFH